ncbi:MAG: hypothetical protein IPL74_12470 [Bacteroidetes bacterium]|nr:hypothetical protein [Bacteroidota bacterium]
MKNIHKNLLLVILTFNFCFYSLSYSQNIPTIQWQNTIGGSSFDFLYSAEQTTDGGYILVGYSYSNISGDKTENFIGSYGRSDYWIVKTDSSGNILWQNTIGGEYEEALTSIKQTTDGDIFWVDFHSQTLQAIKQKIIMILYAQLSITGL